MTHPDSSGPFVPRNAGSIDRRTVLRGAGVAAALPWLEAMAPAQSRLGTGGGRSEAIKRMCFVYFPNGAGLPREGDPKWGQWRWFPNGEGEGFKFNKTLEALEPFRKQLSVIGGLSHPLSRELLGHLAGDSWLTAGDLRFGNYKNRVSVDQVAAHHLKKHTRYPSMVLSVDGGVGYKSRVATLSFDWNGRPIPSEHKHRAIFERYFTPGGGASTEARRKSLQQGRKIVDLVQEDGKRLQRRLGKADQEKLAQYLASLSSVEEQVKRNEQWLDVPMKDFDASGINLDPNPRVDPKAYVRAMYDLMALGFEIDLTRVMTYQVGREDGMGFADNFPNLALGIKKGHHTISHDKAKGHWEEWGRFDQWHAQQFSYFLERLNNIRDENGPVLDNTMVLYGSCCSTTHNARNYPLVLAGGGKLGFKHGAFHKYDEKTPFSNLLLTMLQQVGIQAESFGDSTGSMPELLG